MEAMDTRVQLIRVRFTREENYKPWDVPKNGIVTMDIEEYLKGVVGSEMGSFADSPEALKAQAVAARTYALYRIRTRAKKDFDVDDTTTFQSYHYNKIKQVYTDAVEATRGQVLFHNGKVIDALFSASNGGRTVSALSRWGNAIAYLIEKADPFDRQAGKIVQRSHGVGMSQWGAHGAAQSGLLYPEILSFYYEGTQLEDAYGKSTYA
jgi:peptidoglycan hydrolase-like amidase